MGEALIRFDSKLTTLKRADLCSLRNGYFGEKAGYPHIALSFLSATLRLRPEGNCMEFEIIDSDELARRWNLPATWVREQCRTRCLDPIPHIRLGRYVRFRWASPELREWLARRQFGKKSS